MKTETTPLGITQINKVDYFLITSTYEDCHYLVLKTTQRTFPFELQNVHTLPGNPFESKYEVE